MVKAVRGMRDVLPVEGRRWRTVEAAMRSVLGAFAYEEVHLPLLEFTELFARGVGESTDIVEKEMYTMNDRDGDSLSLRPEGTASCVRALNENGLLFNQTQKVFYAGPMFRYERPQKGRYRQFYQVGAEVFGFPGPDVDAELIAMCAAFWAKLGLTDHVRLEINTLGSGASRQSYRDALVAYLEPLADDLDEDSKRRLETNPLRILDSKDAGTQTLLSDAPIFSDYLDPESKTHFAELCSLLDDLGIAYVVNPKLVRGLDYYTHVVFEWMTDDLGAQGTICGGGRYDGLVERLGGKATPAAGFALGLERVLLLHEIVHQDVVDRSADIYICPLSGPCLAQAMSLADELRGADGARAVRVHMGGGNLKKQLKRADASGAQWAVLLGEDEMATNELTIKHLRDAAVGQMRMPQAEAVERLVEATG